MVQWGGLHRELHLLQGVLLETLRLHPPAYLVGRCASLPVSLAGYQLPAGPLPSLPRPLVWEFELI